MPCEHCPQMRRAEGGISLGGRALPVWMPGCSCPELETALEGEDVELVDQTGTLMFGGYYRWDHPMRICPGLSRVLQPLIQSVVVTNYPPGEVEFLAYMRVYNGVNVGCTWNPEEFPLAYCNNYNGEIAVEGAFNPGTTPDTFNYIRFFVDLSRSGGFIDPPIFNVTYNFS